MDLIILLFLNPILWMTKLFGTKNLICWNMFVVGCQSGRILVLTI